MSLSLLLNSCSHALVITAFKMLTCHKNPIKSLQEQALSFEFSGRTRQHQLCITTYLFLRVFIRQCESFFPHEVFQHFSLRGTREKVGNVRLEGKFSSCTRILSSQSLPALIYNLLLCMCIVKCDY